MRHRLVERSSLRRGTVCRGSGIGSAWRMGTESSQSFSEAFHRVSHEPGFAKAGAALDISTGVYAKLKIAALLIEYIRLSSLPAKAPTQDN